MGHHHAMKSREIEKLRREEKMIDFDALDEARVRPRPGHPTGHTVAEMCAEIGVTVDTYYKLRRRGHAPRLRTVAAFRRYVRNADKK